MTNEPRVNLGDYVLKTDLTRALKTGVVKVKFKSTLGTFFCTNSFDIVTEEHYDAAKEIFAWNKDFLVFDIDYDSWFEFNISEVESFTYA